MKNLKISAYGTLFFAGALFAEAAPKTVFPVKINPATVDQEPYRYNGVVLTGDARGSGFCAWNPRTFFSAAHVVYSETGWTEPPIWTAAVNDNEVDLDRSIQCRGYYRFSSYADIVNKQGASEAFGKDVILGFAFKNLIQGSAATLNLDGTAELRSKVPKLITGYPASIFYTDKETDGYHMYETGPFNIPFFNSSQSSVHATLVTTGPGNSGGPIWTKNKKQEWSAAGIVVGGLPSETTIYAFSKEVNLLTRSVEPVIQKRQQAMLPMNTVSASTLYFPYQKPQVLPDGTVNWSSFPVTIKGFGDRMNVKSIKLDLSIDTTHRGDLQVYLAAPGGYTATLHNEEGAGKNNLVLRDLDVSSEFTDVRAEGKWILRVRDRLKGDIATFKSFRLEVTAVESSGSPP